ncbi:hypothetical protein [Lichenihabitans psoromatis]|uniref:hypothetical protein n=1 Tax=Lichenihabitans psoromatis TaxID=2528642 RepID=UPI0010385D31|nr:hypothetical protein [Lichenihabitans psoromatis]
MTEHPNNHSRERTHTVAIRDAVERALGSSVSEDQMQDVATRVGQIVDKYSSPYPDSEWLGAVERLSPGLTKSIVEASIEDLKHRRHLEEQSLKIKAQEISLVAGIARGERESTSQGRMIGFLAYIAAYAFSALAYYLGAKELSYLFFGAGSLGIVTQLIRGGRSESSVMVTAETAKDPGQDVTTTP